MTHDESLSKSQMRRIELTQPRMTHDELMAIIKASEKTSNKDFIIRPNPLIVPCADWTPNDPR